MSIFTSKQKQELDEHITRDHRWDWSNCKYKNSYPDCLCCGYEFCKAESKDDEICDACLEIAEQAREKEDAK